MVLLWLKNRELKLLVGEVDAKLLEGVEIKNLETCNIQDTDEVVTGKSGGPCLC